MARYIDVDELIKTLEERDRNTCNAPLSHSTLSRILRYTPTADVVPRSEVDKVRLLAYESGKREVAREIRTALLKEIIEARNRNFEAIRERETKHNVNRFKSTFCYYCDGKIHALDGMFYLVNEVLEKYAEDK